MSRSILLGRSLYIGAVDASRQWRPGHAGTMSDGFVRLDRLLPTTAQPAQWDVGFVKLELFDLADSLDRAPHALGEGFLREVERFAAQFEPGPERKLLWHISLLPYRLFRRVCLS